MSTCCVHNRDAGRLFGWFAKRYRKRFARQGLEPSQKHLMKGLTRSGFSRATLLDIGCGVGYLHQQLLQAGAASAVGVDLSAKMLEEARAQAREQGLTERTDYREGDFVERADGLAPADIVILDKVICCYPDADALVRSSARMARRVYGFTIPRDRWSVRLALSAGWVLLSDLQAGDRKAVEQRTHLDVDIPMSHSVRTRTIAEPLLKIEDAVPSEQAESETLARNPHDLADGTLPLAGEAQRCHRHRPVEAARRKRQAPKEPPEPFDRSVSLSSAVWRMRSRLG